MELLKLLSTNEIVAQVANFLLLLFFLRVFFWKRILKLLDERKARIAAELEKIENSKKEVADLKSDYESKINSIEETAQVKIRQALEESKSMASQIARDANQEAQKIIASAKADIKYEIAKAREELKEHFKRLRGE